MQKRRYAAASSPSRLFGLRIGPDGTLYLSADAEGSVLALRPEPRHR